MARLELIICPGEGTPPRAVQLWRRYNGPARVFSGKKGYITLKEAPHGESISSRFPVHDISLRVPTSTDYMYFTQK